MTVLRQSNHLPRQNAKPRTPNAKYAKGLIDAKSPDPCADRQTQRGQNIFIVKYIFRQNFPRTFETISVDAINRGGHGVFAMQNTQKLNQLLNEIGFNAFTLDAFLSMQSIMGGVLGQNEAFNHLCSLVENEANNSDRAREQFIVIADNHTGSKVALCWLTDTTDEAGVFSEVTWFCNFYDYDWNKVSGICAENGTTIDGAMELSEAIGNTCKI
jgi:hypothetical protein